MSVFYNIIIENGILEGCYYIEQLGIKSYQELNFFEGGNDWIIF